MPEDFDKVRSRLKDQGVSSSAIEEMLREDPQAGSKARFTKEEVARSERVVGRQKAFPKDLFAKEVIPERGAQAPVSAVDTKTQIQRDLSSPELEQISKEREAIVGRQAQAAQELADVETRGLEGEAKLLEEQALTLQEIGTERERVDVELQSGVVEGVARVQELQTEFEGMEPKSFWQRADTQDKILMSLAVIIGGIGQGLSGSKVNAAAQAMDKAVDRDLQLQRIAMNKKLKEIDLSKGSLSLKQKSRQEVHAKFAAREQAAITHTARLIESLQLRTKGETKQAALQEFLSELEAGALEKQQEIESRLAGTISTEMVEKAPDIAQRTIYTSIQEAQADLGRPPDINTDQGKATATWILNEPYVEAMEVFHDNLTKDEWKRMRGAMKDFMSTLAEEELPLGGEAMKLARIRLGNTGRDIMEAALPGKGGVYFRNLFAFANEVTRDKSGASIAPSEYYSELLKLGLSDLPSVEDVRGVRDTMRNTLKGYRIRSGVPAGLFFEDRRRGEKSE